MKDKKWFISKRSTQVLIFIVVTIVAVIISSKIISKNGQDEQKMIRNYEGRNQKYELLKGIANKAIKEGVGIDISGISNNEIHYRIYNEDENIIFYYYLQEDSTNSSAQPRYNATITLSNEYRILDEDYSINPESYDEYVKSYTSEVNRIAVLIAVLFVVALYFGIYMLSIIIYFSHAIYIDKKKEKLVNSNDLKDSEPIKFLGQNHFLVHGWQNNNYIMTSKELYNRVMEDSKSDYNWIAPARELVRICKKPEFPANYATDIQIAILNCFANIEHLANCGKDRYFDNPLDKEAVQYCYNSLYWSDNENAVSAREYYLSEIIQSASSVRCTFDPLYHPGPTFHYLCENWRKSKFNEYISHKEIEFKSLFETLHNEFIEMIKNAEENGDFAEDDKKAREKVSKVIRKLSIEE